MPVEQLGTHAAFYRPVNDSTITCTLFIGNLGPPVGWAHSDIEQEICKLGFESRDFAVDVPDEAKSFCFITFADAVSAERAAQAIAASDCFGRQLNVRPARLSPKYKVLLPQDPHASSHARLSSASSNANTQRHMQQVLVFAWHS